MSEEKIAELEARLAQITRDSAKLIVINKELIVSNNELMDRLEKLTKPTTEPPGMII